MGSAFVVPPSSKFKRLEHRGRVMSTNRSVVEICNEFLLGDRQVARLRKVAIANGGQPARLGFAWRGLEAVWPLDLGRQIAPRADCRARGTTKAARFTAFADFVLVARFAKLVDQLSCAEMLAAGIPERGGAAVEVPSPIWQRGLLYLDLKNGDLFEASEITPSFWERPRATPDLRKGSIDEYERRAQGHDRKPQALFRALVFHCPPSANTAMFHVQPTAYPSLRPATVDSQAVRYGIKKLRAQPVADEVANAIAKHDVAHLARGHRWKMIAGLISKDLHNPPSAEALAKAVRRHFIDGKNETSENL